MRHDGAKDAAREADLGVDGAPYLTELRVDGPAPDGGTFELVPEFSPSIYDYYVRCGAGVNKLEVAMKASPGAESLVILPTLSPELPKQTLALDANENDAIVAVAANASGSVEYWVRCLPHDFPIMTMSTHGDAGSPPSGYYLLGTAQPTKGDFSYAMVVDGNGVPVWYVRGDPHSGVGDIDSVVSGAISFFSGVGKPWQVHFLSPLNTTYPAPSGTVLDLHELQVPSDGNYLVISNPVATGVDLTGLALPLPDGGVHALGPGSAIAQCNLVEFDPSTGDVAWTWFSDDHLDPVKDNSIVEIVDYLPDGGPVIDPFHCNSIDIEPASGNLLVSARDMSSVFYIERSTGTILWKMGGKTFTKENARYVVVPDPFTAQHDARLLPGWTCSGRRGQLTMFDDESDKKKPARAVVYDVSLDEPDGGTPPDGGVVDCGAEDAGDADGASIEGGSSRATVAWQFSGYTNSSSRGSFRISPDGSRVIGWGATGMPNLVFTEVDVHGNVLRDFHFSTQDESYRVIKVPLGTFDVDVLRRTTGQL